MILVTGATGFIGQALSAELARREWNFIPVGRTPARGAVSVGEFSRETDFSSALSKDVKAVVHLVASAPASLTGEQLLDHCMSVNCEATVNLAQQAANAGVDHFVFVSTIKVHGEESEPSKPFGPRDQLIPKGAYAISKALAEERLSDWAHSSRMRVTVIRPPMVYGPGVQGNFGALMGLVSRRVPLPFGSVKNKRSMVYVSNLVDLILFCLTTDRDTTALPLIVSDGESFSTRQIIEAIGNAMGKPPFLLPVPEGVLQAAAHILGKGEYAQRLLSSLEVDDRDLRELLGWSPPVSPQLAIFDTVGSYLAGKVKDR